MTEDPIVDEVRKHRQENAAKFAYNIRAIAEDARKREKTSRHQIVDLQGKARPRKPRAKSTSKAPGKR